MNGKDKQKLLQALANFEEEFWFPHTYDKKSLELIFKEEPYYLISLLLLQAQSLLDEWRIEGAKYDDLYDLMGKTKKMGAP